MGKGIINIILMSRYTIPKMSSFSEKALTEKLAGLNNSQQSIQTMSLWLIHHRKHAKTIVKVWYEELQKAKQSRKLVFVYLANDVVQNSKKKGTEFTMEFTTVIDRAFAHVVEQCQNDRTKKALDKTLNVWAQRNVFDKELIKRMKASFSGGEMAVPPDSPEQPASAKKAKVAEKKPAKEPEEVNPAKFQEILQEQEEAEEDNFNPEDMPDPEVLVKALRELENAASSDAAVREKIAKLPPEVQDISMLEKIQDKEAAESLSKLVNDACSLLADYNNRLSRELEDRQQTVKMFHNYRIGQKLDLAAAEDKLEQYKAKHAKVTSVRKELKSHIQNLPDLTLLPDVTGGLAPLPSAGDLFSIDM